HLPRRLMRRRRVTTTKALPEGRVCRILKPCRSTLPRTRRLSPAAPLKLDGFARKRTPYRRRWLCGKNASGSARNFFSRLTRPALRLHAEKAASSRRSQCGSLPAKSKNGDAPAFLRNSPRPPDGHRVAQRAEADLDDIWLYVAKESSSIETANRLIDTITHRFFTLARFPYMGRSREEDVGPADWSLPVGEYAIPHFVEDHDVLLLHVVQRLR